MTERDVLRRAKEVLLERGWAPFAQHEWDDNRCLLGAITDAAGMVWCNTGSAQGPVVPYATFYSHPVYLRFERLLGGDVPHYWNDVPGRTVDEVFALIDRALAELPPTSVPCEQVEVFALIDRALAELPPTSVPCEQVEVFA